MPLFSRCRGLRQISPPFDQEHDTISEALLKGLGNSNGCADHKYPKRHSNQEKWRLGHPSESPDKSANSDPIRA